MAQRNYLLTTWYAPGLEIRPSSTQGDGMFATRPIHEGDNSFHKVLTFIGVCAILSL